MKKKKNTTDSPRSAGDIKYVEDRFSERSKKKKKKGKATPRKKFQLGTTRAKSAMKQGTILKSSSRYSI
jgi:hypothetical protein